MIDDQEFKQKMCQPSFGLISRSTLAPFIKGIWESAKRAFPLEKNSQKSWFLCIQIWKQVGLLIRITLLAHEAQIPKKNNNNNTRISPVKIHTQQ